MLGYAIRGWVSLNIMQCTPCGGPQYHRWYRQKCNVVAKEVGWSLPFPAASSRGGSPQWSDSLRGAPCQTKRSVQCAEAIFDLIFPNVLKKSRARPLYSKQASRGFNVDLCTNHELRSAHQDPPEQYPCPITPLSTHSHLNHLEDPLMKSCLPP